MSAYKFLSRSTEKKEEIEDEETTDEEEETTDEEDVARRMEAILDWAKTRKDFNTTTIEGIKDYYNSDWVSGFTERQTVAINNIYFKYRIYKTT